MSAGEKGCPFQAWPFQAWQQIAIRRFGLAPSEFWAMPMRDWLALLSGLNTGGLDRDALYKLLEIYPDEEDENGHDATGG
jgi:hypothetical protein